MFTLVLTVSILITYGCSSDPIPEEEQVLFSVNDFELTVFDFENAYVGYLIESGRNDTKGERLIFMNQWIDELLLAEDAANKDYTGKQAYRRAIERQKRKIMADVYFVDEVNKILDDPTEDELRIAFGKSKRKVYVRHLFSRNPVELIEPYQLLENGESFVDVANAFYETEEYDSLAGYLGPISYFNADDKFAETAFSLPQGEYSEPVRSKYGYHIIYIDFIEFPAILTEDEYQLKIDGTTSRLKLRQQALSTNDYVYNLMSSLDVEVERDNILKLREAIAGISEEQDQIRSIQDETDVESWDNSKIDRLRIEFEEEEVLGSYILNGTSYEFTFGDYLSWLRYLPFAESKAYTGASVGRAMRNQVFYQLAEENGYADNDFVNKELQKFGRDKLAQVYMYDIIQDAIKDTAQVDVPADFRNRMLKNVQLIIDTDYWFIAAQNKDEAFDVKEKLSEGKSPQSFDNFNSITDARVSLDESNYNIIRDAILNTPLIAFSDTDGWIVINVLSREVIRGDSENLVKVDVQKRYKAYTSVNQVVDSLRKEAEVYIDTLLFDKIYELSRESD
ncbi:peptidylprolyl isomerase [Balneola sp. MJW-20]|uniref:peptidylprolyl isomerase n=1 Tax=Gracilimonas aurantiaca TaxID=3234185 RepID=UPI0034659A2D